MATVANITFTGRDTKSGATQVEAFFNSYTQTEVLSESGVQLYQPYAPVTDNVSLQTFLNSN